MADLPDNARLVAMDDGDEVGEVFLRVEHRGISCAVLWGLEVREDRRHRGIGTALMEEARRWAAAQRAECLELAGPSMPWAAPPL